MNVYPIDSQFEAYPSSPSSLSFRIFNVGTEFLDPLVFAINPKVRLILHFVLVSSIYQFYRPSYNVCYPRGLITVGLNLIKEYPSGIIGFNRSIMDGFKVRIQIIKSFKDKIMIQFSTKPHRHTGFSALVNNECRFSMS